MHYDGTSGSHPMAIAAAECRKERQVLPRLFGVSRRYMMRTFTKVGLDALLTRQNWAHDIAPRNLMSAGTQPITLPENGTAIGRPRGRRSRLDAKRGTTFRAN